jgi:hypothetical protein
MFSMACLVSQLISTKLTFNVHYKVISFTTGRYLSNSQV